MSAPRNPEQPPEAADAPAEARDPHDAADASEAPSSSTELPAQSTASGKSSSSTQKPASGKAQHKRPAAEAEQPKKQRVPQIPPLEALVTHAEGFELRPSPRSSTGYEGVTIHQSGPSQQYKAQSPLQDGVRKTIGYYPTAVEAAVAYAKYCHANPRDVPDVADESDGVRLFRSRRSASGYLGVTISTNPALAKPYYAISPRDGKGTRRCLGQFATAVEAARAYALHVRSLPGRAARLPPSAQRREPSESQAEDYDPDLEDDMAETEMLWREGISGGEEAGQQGQLLLSAPVPSEKHPSVAEAASSETKRAATNEGESEGGGEDDADDAADFDGHELPEVDFACGVQLHLSRRNKTGYEGVRFYPKQRKYRAVGPLNGGPLTGGPTRNIGYFDTAVAAAVAFARHVLVLRGIEPPPDPSAAPSSCVTDASAHAPAGPSAEVVGRVAAAARAARASKVQARSSSGGATAIADAAPPSPPPAPPSGTPSPPSPWSAADQTAMQAVQLPEAATAEPSALLPSESATAGAAASAGGGATGQVVPGWRAAQKAAKQVGSSSEAPLTVGETSTEAAFAAAAAAAAAAAPPTGSGKLPASSSIAALPLLPSSAAHLSALETSAGASPSGLKRIVSAGASSSAEDLLPDGWEVVHHVSISGQQYKRYRGPDGTKAQSLKQAWAIAEGGGKAPDPATLVADLVGGGGGDDDGDGETTAKKRAGVAIGASAELVDRVAAAARAARASKARAKEGGTRGGAAGPSASAPEQPSKKPRTKADLRAAKVAEAAARAAALEKAAAEAAQGRAVAEANGYRELPAAEAAALMHAQMGAALEQSAVAGSAQLADGDDEQEIIEMETEDETTPQPSDDELAAVAPPVVAYEPPKKRQHKTKAEYRASREAAQEEARRRRAEPSKQKQRRLPAPSDDDDDEESDADAPLAASVPHGASIGEDDDDDPLGGGGGDGGMGGDADDEQRQQTEGEDDDDEGGEAMAAVEAPKRAQAAAEAKAKGGKRKRKAAALAGAPSPGGTQRAIPARGVPKPQAPTRQPTPPGDAPALEAVRAAGRGSSSTAAKEAAREDEEDEGPRCWAGACDRTKGCVLPAKHRGKCKVGAFEEEDYEVEEILDERAVAGKRAKKSGGALPVEYFVKWKGWPIEDATWEPASALAGCPGVLKAWRASKQ